MYLAINLLYCRIRIPVPQEVCLSRQPVLLEASSREEAEISGAAETENYPCLVACFFHCRLYNKLSVVKTLEKAQKSNVFIKVQEKHVYFEKN
ncbi:hypothetical protein [uncultured Eubacterium sp.]|uniref:hypothetical protein n=1 Tax=uncultured Eubacterium sp. TaxID=165185 RepID=UPI0025CC0447|nr:hypothetical protein [uncultured Eubacterium sp.]